MAKRGIASHPKTLDLAERLGIMDCYAVGVLETFWQWVASYHPDGDLTGTKPSIFGRGISYRGNAKKVWDALVAAGFIDHRDGKFFVHDWPEHAEDSIHIRLARSRNFCADGTTPRLNRIAHQEREQIQRDYEKLVRTPGAPTSAPPLPKPLPKPKPEPMPHSSGGALEPVTPEKTAAIPSDEKPAKEFPLDVWSDRLYSKHIKRRDRELVNYELRRLYERCVERGVDPERKFSEIEACLIAWNETPEWREKHGRFAPKLAEWLNDEGFEQWPASDAGQPERKSDRELAWERA
jgi:hypothetical protein